LHVYKANLEAFIDWQQAEICLKQREVRTLRTAAINRKLRSKKTVQLKIIDANTYAAWCEEMTNKLKGKAKKQVGEGIAGQKKQQQPKKRHYRRKRARALSTNDGNGYRLERDIDLFIGRGPGITDESGDDDNGVEGQISEDVQVSLPPLIRLRVAEDSNAED
jgi:hypothetical protein